MPAPQLGFFLMHLDLEKSKLPFQACSGAGPIKISAKAGSTGECGAGSRPGAKRSAGRLCKDEPRPFSGCLITKSSTSRASEPRPSTARPQTLPLGKMRSLESCSRKIKVPLQLYWVKAKLNLGYSHVCYRGRGSVRKNLLAFSGATEHEGIDKHQDIKQP